MKNIITIIFLFLCTATNAQFCSQVITLDQIEFQDWPGYWQNGVGITKTNYFTSSTSSAVLEGIGTGSSSTERDVYILPNITGLNVANNYKILLHIGAYTLGGTVCGTCPAGNDVEDSVQITYSSDGGVTFIKEISIIGRSNAYWNYNNFGIIKPANGTNFIRGPVLGGNRTFTGDGYSTIELQLPAAVTQVAAKIYCNVNALGESWWIDDIMLIEVGPCPDLPVELISFTGNEMNEDILLKWTTASEDNNNYFILKRSSDAISWESINKQSGAGNSNRVINYSYVDNNPYPASNYYKLTQFDYDGKSSDSKIIYIKLHSSIIQDIYFNIYGQEIEWNENLPKGIYYKISEGSSATKIIK